MATDIDKENADFWNELCGTGLAKHLGITDYSLESLKQFDDYYLGFYPYLLHRVPVSRMAASRVLEIGLGYGTLGQKIAEAGADYVGLDIASSPVWMMNHRLRMQGLSGRAEQGTILRCPFPDQSMDFVVSIGCFHHTGDTQRCIHETWRVLKPGGTAYVMVYNQFSYRHWLKWPGKTFMALLGEVGLPTAVGASTEEQRKAYDSGSQGDGAPETVFFSIAQLRNMFARFSSVTFHKENCDSLTFRGRVLVSRAALLGSLGHASGLDIYVAATR